MSFDIFDSLAKFWKVKNSKLANQYHLACFDLGIGYKPVKIYSAGNISTIEIGTVPSDAILPCRLNFIDQSFDLASKNIINFNIYFTLLRNLVANQS